MENTCFLKAARPCVSWASCFVRQCLVQFLREALPAPFRQVQACQSLAGSAMCVITWTAFQRETVGFWDEKLNKKHLSKVLNFGVA